MTLLTVYKDVYLPRREERKGAPPRRRSRLDMELSIKRFVKLAGDKEITEITKKDAEKFVRTLQVGSVATKRKAITCLSTICNAAVAADLILHNPFRGLGPDRASVVAARRSYQRFDMERRRFAGYRIVVRCQGPQSAVDFLFVFAPFVKADLLMTIAPDDELVRANPKVSRATFHLVPGFKRWVEIEMGYFGALYHPGERFDRAIAKAQPFPEHPDLRLP